MIRIVEGDDSSRVYRNIYSLLLSNDNLDIKNIHSVDVNKTENNVLNIAFDYKDDYRVMIDIYSDRIEISAPDIVKSRFIKLITDSYPEYESLFNLST